MAHPITRRQLFKYSAAVGTGLLLPWQWNVPSALASVQIPQTPLPASSIPRFTQPLPTFVGARVNGTRPLTVSAHEIQQKVFPASFYESLEPQFRAGTYVWAYAVSDGQKTYGPLWPSFTIEAQRFVPTVIKYTNNLPMDPVLQKLVTTDQTLHWANPLGLAMDDPARRDPYAGPPPLVTHIHGAEVPSEFDGGPDQWFTPDGRHGAGYRSLRPTSPNAAIFRYPNEQFATTLFYHDHALGATRLNVYRGLAGFYFLRDLRDTGRPDNIYGFPAGDYEIELAIQDRSFDTNGQLLFDDEGDNPDAHPYWLPEFFGNTIVVNGKPWPYLDVEPRRYRFRLVNGSNARFYTLRLMNLGEGRPGPNIWVIGSDGGLLEAPALPSEPEDPAAHKLLFAPGERYDVIVDFAGCAGQTLTLTNDAREPFPDGDPADELVTQVMQFRVVKPLRGTDNSYNPASGKPIKFLPLIRLASNGVPAPRTHVDVKRQLTLVEEQGENGPLEVLLNNTKWNGKRMMNGDPIPGSTPDGMGNYITEMPRVGSTEVWEIINLTMDAHPIHVHLAQFQLLNRQDFHADDYRALYDSLFPGNMFMPAYGPPKNASVPNSVGALGGNPDVTPFLENAPTLPDPQEVGWKDTFIMRPHQVTRIIVRFAPQHVPLLLSRPGVNKYPFDPTSGPGYVWHCHIIDHEDNEMMRPYKLRG